MAAFLKNLARMLGSAKPGPEIYLAAFGKHPGWNDHMDDLGVETDDLITAKRLLYVQGINQNIDAATWEKLDASQSLADFRHDFLWHMPSSAERRSLIAGRFWSSVDGKGRAKYPMVLCVGTIELPDGFVAHTALPFIAQTHEKCIAATEASTIRKIMDSGRETLRTLIQSPMVPDILEGTEIAQVASSADLAPSREGFYRIVYYISRNMSAYRTGAPASTTRRPEQIRVPLCGMSTENALLFWCQFCLTLLDPSSTLLLLAPDPHITRNEFFPSSTGWIDIIVGEPSAANLFCIKASTKSVPLTSDIPYELDPSFRSAVDHFINECAALPAGAPLPAWPHL